MLNGSESTLQEIRDDLRASNRLMILALVRQGIKQKDVAAAVGVSESVVSRMFPEGLLRRVAQSRPEPV